MNEPNWSRAYYCVAIVACLIIPITALGASITRARIAPMLSDFGVQLPTISRFFVSLPPSAHWMVAAVALALIGLLAVRRSSPMAGALSMLIFVGCAAFHLAAVIVMHFAILALFEQLPR